MKQVLLAIALFFSLQALVAQTQSITVNVSNIKTIKGAVFVGLCDNEAQFLKENVTGLIEKVTANTATVTFKDIAPGNYAISLFHDVNSNDKMDTNFIGIPKEPYGISNNAKGFMGAPKWKDAVFTVSTEDIVQNIKL